MTPAKLDPLNKAQEAELKCIKAEEQCLAVQKSNANGQLLLD